VWPLLAAVVAAGCATSVAQTATTASRKLLDPSFGIHGVAVDDLYLRYHVGAAHGEAIALGPRGRVSVVGNTHAGAVRLAQFDANGRRVRGLRRLLARPTWPGLADVGVGAIPRLVALSNGKLLILSYDEEWSGPPNNSSRELSVLQRVLADGRPDPSFGDHGTVLIALEGQGSRPVDVVVLRDGRIVAAVARLHDPSGDTPPSERPLLTRLHADGSPDPTFGSAGRVDVPFEIRRLVLDRAGRLLVAGSLGRAPSSRRIGVVARYLPNGRLDRSYGGGRGLVALDLARPRETHVDDAALQPAAGRADRLVVAGRVGSSAWTNQSGVAGFRTASAVIVRLDGDGRLDNSFGTHGVHVEPVQQGLEFVVDEAVPLAVSHNGRVVLRLFNSLVRLTRSGARDRSFGGGRVCLGRGRMRANDIHTYSPITVDGRERVLVGDGYYNLAALRLRANPPRVKVRCPVIL
jgi:uncharacterized delta-60 repeat protein